MTTEPLPKRALVRGEEVAVIGPTPRGWTGLGHGPVLVKYPDGEEGAVNRADLKPVPDAQPPAA